jgi:N-acetylglucosamine-6-phosphate deacetylase
MTFLTILHADILTPTGLLRDAILTAENGIIISVEPYRETTPLAAGHVLDGRGLLASPGWIDIQINGGFGFDFTFQPESIWEVASRLPRLGVSAFLPTIITSPLEVLRRAIKVFQAGPPPEWHGATSLGLHLEGPFLNPIKIGAHNPQHLLAPDIDLIPEWRVENGIRMVTLAPELPGALDLVHELRQRGIVVSAGHSLATYEQAIAAFEAGVSCATHLFNAMPPLEHRSPGLVGALLTRPTIPVGLIADGIHSHPALLQLTWMCKGAKSLILVTDAISALEMPTGEYQLGDQVIYVDSANVPSKEGMFAGSTLTLQVAVQNMMKFCNLRLEEILPTVTSTPAALLGLTNKGRLQAGCDADITLLNPKGEVKATIVAGEVEYRTSNL